TSEDHAEKHGTSVTPAENRPTTRSRPPPPGGNVIGAPIANASTSSIPLSPSPASPAATWRASSWSLLSYTFVAPSPACFPRVYLVEILVRARLSCPSVCLSVCLIPLWKAR
ncbi:unnamed protein product, partial [Pylaiella littoralis]